MSSCSPDAVSLSVNARNGPTKIHRAHTSVGTASSGSVERVPQLQCHCRSPSRRPYSRSRSRGTRCVADELALAVGPLRCNLKNELRLLPQRLLPTTYRSFASNALRISRIHNAFEAWVAGDKVKSEFANFWLRCGASTAPRSRTCRSPMSPSPVETAPSPLLHRAPPTGGSAFCEICASTWTSTLRRWPSRADSGVTALSILGKTTLTPNPRANTQRAHRLHPVHPDIRVS